MLSGPRIILLDQYEEIGGGQVVLIELARQLVASRAEVYVVCPSGPLADACTAAGATHLVGVSPRSASTLRAAWSLVSLRPTKVIANGGKVLPLAVVVRLLASLARVRLTTAYVNHSSGGTWLRRTVIGSLARMVDAEIPVAGSFPRKVNSLDAPPLGLSRAVATAIEEGCAPSGQRSIKAMGRADPMKGFDVLAEALALVGEDARDATFVALAPSLEGRKPDYERQLRQSLWKRLVEGRRTSSWFEPGDIVVIPSRYGEAVCLTAQEAMLSGCLVVAPPIGDLALLVRTGATGFSFRPGDAQSLANSIEAAWSLPDADVARVVARSRQAAKERVGGWYCFVRDWCTR